MSKVLRLWSLLKHEFARGNNEEGERIKIGRKGTENGHITELRCILDYPSIIYI